MLVEAALIVHCVACIWLTKRDSAGAVHQNEAMKFTALALSAHWQCLPNKQPQLRGGALSNQGRQRGHASGQQTPVRCIAPSRATSMLLGTIANVRLFHTRYTSPDPLRYFTRGSKPRAQGTWSPARADSMPCACMHGFTDRAQLPSRANLHSTPRHVVHKPVCLTSARH